MTLGSKVTVKDDLTSDYFNLNQKFYLTCEQVINDRFHLDCSDLGCYRYTVTVGSRRWHIPTRRTGGGGGVLILFRPRNATAGPAVLGSCSRQQGLRC